MPRMTGPFGQWGPIVDVKVMLTPQRVDALRKRNIPFAKPVVVAALLDTGASSSCIDTYLVNVLGLQQHGVALIHTPSTGGNFETRAQYDACFVLGEGLEKPLHRILSVIESEFASQGFLVLIGRDLLKDCIFTYNGPKSRYTLRY